MAWKVSNRNPDFHRSQLVLRGYFMVNLACSFCESKSSF